MHGCFYNENIKALFFTKVQGLSFLKLSQDVDFLFSRVFRSILVGLSLTSIDVCALVLIQI